MTRTNSPAAGIARALWHIAACCHHRKHGERNLRDLKFEQPAVQNPARSNIEVVRLHQ